MKQSQNCILYAILKNEINQQINLLTRSFGNKARFGQYDRSCILFQNEIFNDLDNVILQRATVSQTQLIIQRGQAIITRKNRYTLTRYLNAG